MSRSSSASSGGRAMGSWRRSLNLPPLTQPARRAAFPGGSAARASPHATRPSLQARPGAPPPPSGSPKPVCAMPRSGSA
eukprot:4674530-Alexandrium_andersonii.AAC.1